MPVTVLLVDDHRLVREALRDRLAEEPDIAVVGEAGDGAAALDCARSLAPDVVVLDISLPDESGISVARRLRQSGVDAKIAALSLYTDRHFITEMMRAGASAYVTKSCAWDELPRAIRTIAAGQTYVSPAVAGVLASAVSVDEERRTSRELTSREREVLKLVASGTRSPDIARRLNIAVGTVEVHRRNIMGKLGLRSIAEITRYAMRAGIVAT